MHVGAIDTTTGRWQQAACDGIADYWETLMNQLPSGATWVTGSNANGWSAPTYAFISDEPATLRSRQNAEGYRSPIVLP